DFAAAGPYVQIEMNMSDAENDGDLIYKDAIFISPHKFPGGPGTPGILVAKRHLFTNRVPAVPGGGTVSYVSSDGHRYVDDVEHREEGGTPAIIESIRAGLVFQLKEAVGHELIYEREHDLVGRAIERWSKNPGIRVLGNPDAWRLSIVSFMVQRGERMLHHNFVVALLNDLFGIQARGGCSCAGPYGHRLLGIDPNRSAAFEDEIAKGCEGVKPGWVRVNFNYFVSEDVFSFILDAVDWVATHGWKLVADYRFCSKTGQWHHRAGRPKPPMSLNDIGYERGVMEYRSRQMTEPVSALASYLDAADRILCERESALRAAALQDEITEVDALAHSFEHLRWFWLPNEAKRELAKPNAS
ncbi:MAG: aminotransferase class V-fold PLP-dependent enzyme, partial [Myxococcota bacterium]